MSALPTGAALPRSCEAVKALLAREPNRRFFLFYGNPLEPEPCCSSRDGGIAGPFHARLFVAVSGQLGEEQNISDPAWPASDGEKVTRADCVRLVPPQGR